MPLFGRSVPKNKNCGRRAVGSTGRGRVRVEDVRHHMDPFGADAEIADHLFLQHVVQHDEMSGIAVGLAEEGLEARRECAAMRPDVVNVGTSGTRRRNRRRSNQSV